MRSFKVITFGCQMNEHDSEKMSGLLLKNGYDAAGEVEDAGLIIFNTCSIREKAEQKFFSELGKLKRLKRLNPSLKIAVSGCIAQQEGERILRRAPFVDYIFGNQNIPDLPEILDGPDGHVQAYTRFGQGYEHASIPAAREGSPVTAFVNIMFGCDNFCSYCVVPFVRGREKSRRPDDIVREIDTLVAGGVREVTLLGQNVNSYGRGLDDVAGFPELLRLVNDVDGLMRIRFVTSHPKDLSEELIENMSALPKVCESLHLPVQSASDAVLSAMNRGYTFEEYMRKVEGLRKAMPDIALTTDIIVGFPGETEDDFEKTFRAVEDIRYDGIFSFKYSRRPNTKALKLPGHLLEDVKEKRLEAVLELQNRITEQNNAGRVGMVEEVLVEGPDRTGEPGRLTGRSRGGRIVNFGGDESMVGSLVKVRITAGKKHSVVGDLAF
jgi:tRNA-2-methylthio-N6-dimethylallyladenosine synthase